MQVHSLKPKNLRKKRMIVGRGGKKGKTAGRGTKGQNARSGHKKYPEIRDFIKHIPKLRGRGVNTFKSIAKKAVPINLSQIDKIVEAGSVVNPAFLNEKGLVQTVSGMMPKVKILSDGELTKKVIFEGCLVSLKAKEKIQKAGGSVK